MIGRLAASLLALVVASPSLAVAKDTLVIGVAQFPANMHPYIGSQTVQGYIDGIALHRVTAYDNDGKIVCLLCSEVPSLQNGLAKLEDQPDGTKGLAVTLKLKPGLRWGDGAPVTSRDIQFTWKVAGDPNAGFANTHPWTRATSVDVIDDTTAVLHLPRTLVSFALWDELLSEHIDGPIYAAAKAPGDYINHTAYNRDPLNPGLWNGPFIVSDYQSNNSVSFKPNPYWAGTKPGLAGITVRLLENTASLQANLLSGDVDMTPSGIGLSIDQAIALQKSSSDRFRFVYEPQLSYEHIEPNASNPIFQDIRVREALLRGIDVKSIVDRLFGGHAEVARTFINGLDSHYDPSLPLYGYDPARARTLLDQAGWTPGPDGIRRNAAGERLSFEFSTTSGNRVRELTQQVMQGQWKAIGIEASIKNQPSRTFFGELLKHRSFPGMVEFAWTGEIDLPPIRLTSPYIPSEANNWGGQNYGGVSDPALDAAVDAAQYELDPAKQKALWTEMQRIYTTKLLALPLYFREDPDIVPQWLDGFAATGKQTFVTYSAANWHPH